MSITRNGWDVYKSYGDPHTTPFPWVTGSVRKGDHYVVLDYLARRFNNEVERIVKSASWGHNPRPVRGYTDLWSEHAAAVALDFNAPRHGLGRRGTFSRAQVKRIHKILKDLQGSVRWGGDYAGRKDEMHFELIGGNALMKRIANLIRGGKLPGTKGGGATPKPVVPKPKPVKRVKQNSGNSKASNVAIAENLNALGYAAGYADGVPGPRLRDGVKAYQRTQGYMPGLKVDGDWGPLMQKHFDWVRHVLQPQLNEWAASMRVTELKPDGDYGPLVTRCVKATQTDNYDLYVEAGGYYRDGKAGPITCKFLGCAKHPLDK